MRAVTVAELWAASCAVLAYAHAGFDYVDDVVAQLLALLDDIHIPVSYTHLTLPTTPYV